MEIFDNPEALSRLRKKLEGLAHIPDEEFNSIAGMMHEKHFCKGAVILTEGKICKQYYYIFTGCIRSFALKDGREVNVNFFFEDDFACNFESFRQETPSSSYLIAMEDCVVYSTDKKEAYSFYLHETSLHLFLFRFFQELYFNEENHSNTFKLLSPEERYQHLLTNKPEYLQRVPMVHLASYLGISRETLNRIRKKYLLN